MSGLVQDVRYALRQLRKSPGFALVAIVSIALGIGAGSAVFSLVNAILLRSLPVPNPHELRVLRWTGNDVQMTSLNDQPNRQGNRWVAHSVTHPMFLSLREHGKPLADIFGFQPLQDITFRAKSDPFTTRGMMVSDNFFSGLGLHPFIGRLLSAEDFADSGTNVVITDDLWEKQFGRDPGALGQTVILNDSGFTIVGILPHGFSGVVPGDPSEFYVPMSSHSQFLYRPITESFHWFVRLMARLRPGVNDTQLGATLDVVFARDATVIMKEPRMLVEPGHSGLEIDRNNYRRPLLLMLGIVALIMLVACANLGGLSLARGAVRQRELAVRAALGAGRWVLIRQCIIESLILALIACGVGVLLATWGKTAISRLLAGSADGLHYDLSLDLTVLGFSIAIALATALLSGLVPAVRAGRVDPLEGLKVRASLRAPGLPTGKALVAGQICFSLLLVTGAGLYIRTLINLTHIDAGFNTEKLLLFQLNPASAGYEDAQRNAFYEQAQSSLAAIPGVRGAAFMGYPLLGNRGWSGGLSFEDHPPHSNEDMQSYRLAVSESFFSTMGIALLQGREFTAADTPDSYKVAVVNEAFVREYPTDRGPLGRTVSILGGNWRIVGVCRDTKVLNIKEAVSPTVYFPFRQISDLASVRNNFGTAYFALRTALPPLTLTTAARKAVVAIDRNVPLANVTTQEDLRDNNISQERLFATLCSVLAGLALLLSCIGLYGLMAYHVARRTGEIAVRMALGASRGNVAIPILREALLLAACGIATGVPLAFVLTQFIKSQLYGVAPNDPVIIGGAIVLLLAVAFLSAWIPARRAARVDPMVALRYE